MLTLAHSLYRTDGENDIFNRLDDLIRGIAVHTRHNDRTYLPVSPPPSTEPYCRLYSHRTGFDTSLMRCRLECKKTPQLNCERGRFLVEDLRNEPSNT